MVLLPTLESGDYELEILTQSTGGGSFLKQARTIVLDHILTVV